MSSSDSEEFESADEDYNESPKKGVEKKIDQENTTTQQVESTKSLPKKDPTTDHIKEPRLGTDEKTVASKISHDEINLDNLKIQDEGGKAQTANVEISDDDADGDDWDIDGWGDNEGKIVNKDEAKLEVNDKPEDGWSDFDDDWGEDPIDNKERQNINSVFPVLDDMSPGKHPNKPDGFLQNILKGSTKPEPISSYDAFPILNEMTPKKNATADVFQDAETEIKTDVIDDNKSKSSTSSWGWKPWGGVVSTIFSTATEGVSSLTTHVSQGLSNVIESGMGVPDPGELAKINKERAKLRETNEENKLNKEAASHKELKQDEALLPSFGNIVSGVTQIGNKVITGGLDTLEGIGKKTMTILQENDPLLLNKRKMLGLESEKPVLSQVLREAKEKSEEIERNLKQMHRNSYKKQLHFETLFDHYYGLVHLEALEMLSKQSSLKLQSLMEPLSGKALAELQETLNEVKELCELGDIENDENDGLYTPDELSKKLTEAVEDLGVQTDIKEILKCWEDNVAWLTENQSTEPQEIYEKGLRCLAETCALAIHRYHKIAEMLLIKDHHSTANEADSLVQLTTTICWHLNGIAARFGGKLNSFEQNEETSSLITSIFVEVYNSNSYVQSAFQLFIPILQIGAA